jgi:hypothetical protein
MSAEVCIYGGKKIIAEASSGTGSAWVDITIADRANPEALKVTVFFSGSDRVERSRAYADGINSANAMEPA